MSFLSTYYMYMYLVVRTLVLHCTNGACRRCRLGPRAKGYRVRSGRGTNDSYARLFYYCTYSRGVGRGHMTITWRESDWRVRIRKCTKCTHPEIYFPVPIASVYM